MSVPRAAVALAIGLAALAGGCAPTAVPAPASVGPSPPVTSSGSATPTAPAATAPSATPRTMSGPIVLAGRIVTLGEPPVVEAVLIEDGLVAATGRRDDVLALAGDGVPVMDLGEHVAYPGFVDAHAHWIGDREYYGLDTPGAAIDAAATRGWTSVSEQWVNPERLRELTALADEGALPLRVDAYLALNYDREFFGDWYGDLEPGAVDDHLRVRGLKIHLDDGWGTTINWEPAELTATIARANDAGWQVSVHAMSSPAMELVLDAFEAAIGPTGPNPLHHRIEHAMQVTDDQLARLAGMDIAIVSHFEGVNDWLLDDRTVAAFDRDDPGHQLPLLNRWRDFVDAGLHLASSTDAPWTFEGQVLLDAMGRPVDHIAAGMDGHVRTTVEPPAWTRNQRLTAEQALRTVTLDAAWALGDEARRGHLSPGALGDVTILSGDVTAATADEIRAMTVIATIVGGVPVHCDEAEVCARMGG